MNNYVDLTGMVFNIYEHITNNGKILFFRLSISNGFYDENNELQITYDHVDCAISKRHNQKNTKRYDFLKENLIPESLIRIKGKLGSKQNVFFHDETKGKINVLTNIIWIKNYKMLNKKNREVDKPLTNDLENNQQNIPDTPENKKEESGSYYRSLRYGEL